MIGEVHNMLTILERSEFKTKHGVYLFNIQCECGNKFLSIKQHIRDGRRISCGCFKRQLGRVTHGKTGTKEYIIWCGMKTRCNNENQRAANRYIGRGIGYSIEWEHFENFIADMGQAPTSKHTLERIDNEKGYSKENCKWATWKEQQFNKCTNRWLTYKGVTKAFSQWADFFNISWSTFHSRLRLWGEQKAFEVSFSKSGKELNIESQPL